MALLHYIIFSNTSNSFEAIPAFDYGRASSDSVSGSDNAFWQPESFLVPHLCLSHHNPFIPFISYMPGLLNHTDESQSNDASYPIFLEPDS